MSHRVLLGLLLCLGVSYGAQAEEVYQSPEAFLADIFDGKVPAPRVVWLSGALREDVTRILGHAPRSLRVRYWQQGSRSAWILNEIGKERPITAGFVVDHDRLVLSRVLSFRESRGWEIRYPFFTQQFTGAGLTRDERLNRHIDGIAGATLSVRAMTHMARLALLLARHVQPQPITPPSVPAQAPSHVTP